MADDDDNVPSSPFVARTPTTCAARSMQCIQCKFNCPARWAGKAA